MKTLHLVISTLLLSMVFYSCEKNDHAPVIADQEFSLAENSEAGTLVGVVEAFDADKGQVITYEIVDGNEKGEFELDPSNGVLSVSDPDGLDYESTQEFILGVTVSDGYDSDPLESTASIKVKLVDENEFTPLLVFQNFTMDENPQVGQEIGMLHAFDGDIHQTMSYSIVGLNENKYFQVARASGMLSVADPKGFDYELNQTLKIMVQAEDSHPSSRKDTAYVMVTLKDVPE